MATPEGKVKAKVDKMLRSEGVWFYSPQAGPYGVSGIPDRIGIVTGLFLGVEIKADASKKMTARQELAAKKIEAAGGKFFLVYDDATIEEVRKWIVSVRGRGQEGTDSGVGKSTGHPRCCPDSKGSSVEANARPRLARPEDYTGVEGPRVQRSLPHPPLL